MMHALQHKTVIDQALMVVVGVCVVHVWQYDDVLMGKSIFQLALPECHDRIKAAVLATLVRSAPSDALHVSSQ
jgi:hypothetical protein